jgi:hypothetical protein
MADQASSLGRDLKEDSLIDLVEEGDGPVMAADHFLTLQVGTLAHSVS